MSRQCCLFCLLKSWYDKNAAVNFGYHCHDFTQNYNGWEIAETVAVIAKDDCRVFCYINSLGDKINNTAAPIQPNPFWFWEKCTYHKLIIYQHKTDLLWTFSRWLTSWYRYLNVCLQQGQSLSGSRIKSLSSSSQSELLKSTIDVVSKWKSSDGGRLVNPIKRNYVLGIIDYTMIHDINNLVHVHYEN